MEVDKENLRSLSNDDLFKIMKKYGINVGPVNISTRSVYEKKLKNYLESIENGQNPAQTKYSELSLIETNLYRDSRLFFSIFASRKFYNTFTCKENSFIETRSLDNFFKSRLFSK